MGYAIAEAALEAGHETILISGPVSLAPPLDAKFIRVSSSDEMFDAIQRHASDSDVCVLCAAVADYKPARVSPLKIKKCTEKFSLELIRTRDILDSLSHRQQRGFLLVGFAAETNDVEENAARKLREKNCDIIIANDVSGANSPMESDMNEVTILFQNGARQRISRAPKKIIARELVKIFASSARKMFDKKNVMITEPH
jgi:phosphopantothenoylcysteine decarboxylase / phosphopantothenate---cysteine ligase